MSVSGQSYSLWNPQPRAPSGAFSLWNQSPRSLVKFFNEGLLFSRAVASRRAQLRVYSAREAGAVHPPGPLGRDTGRGRSHLFIFSIGSRGWPLGWVVWGAPSRSNNTGIAKPFPHGLV